MITHTHRRTFAFLLASALLPTIALSQPAVANADPNASIVGFVPGPNETQPTVPGKQLLSVADMDRLGNMVGMMSTAMPVIGLVCEYARNSVSGVIAEGSSNDCVPAIMKSA